VKLVTRYAIGMILNKGFGSHRGLRSGAADRNIMSATLYQGSNGPANRAAIPQVTESEKLMAGVGCKTGSCWGAKTMQIVPSTCRFCRALEARRAVL